jgi:hypothetical protein
VSSDLARQIRKGGNLFTVTLLIDLYANPFVRTRMMTSYFIRALAALLDNGSQLLSALDDTSVANEFQ